MTTRQKPKRKLWIGLVILSLALGGFVYFSPGLLFRDAKTRKETQTVEVVLGNIEESVTAQGKLEPKDFVDVGAQVSGQLDKLHVEIGNVVKKGQLIAEIDRAIYESRVAEAKAALQTLMAQKTEAAANVAQAQQKADRNAMMYNQQAIAREVSEDAQTALKVAQAQAARIEAQINQAKSTLEGAQANLNYTMIYAPMDGTVVSQTAREGQTINANQTAPVIVQLANLDVMTVRAQVAEADIGKIREGQFVYFTTLGSSGRRWEAKVRQILPTPETINNVVLYNVLVDVDNKDRQLMTGMSTQMFFVQAHVEGVPVMPVGALGKKRGDQYEIRIMTNKGTEPRLVTPGLINRTLVEVKEGASVGEKVILPVAVSAESRGNERQSGGGHMMGGMPRL